MKIENEKQCLLQIQTMQSPAVENFVEIEGRTYATGKEGKGLYRLIPKGEARFYNEAEPIDLRFQYSTMENYLLHIKELYRKC